MNSLSFGFEPNISEVERKIMSLDFDEINFEVVKPLKVFLRNSKVYSVKTAGINLHLPRFLNLQGYLFFSNNTASSQEVIKKAQTSSIDFGKFSMLKNFCSFFPHHGQLVDGGGAIPTGAWRSYSCLVLLVVTGPL